MSTVEAEDAQDLERSISDAMVTREIAKLQAPVPPSFSIVPLMPGDLPVASTGKPIAAAAPRGMDKPMLDVPPDSPNCAAMLPAMWAGPRPSSRGRTKGRSSRWIDDTTVNARDPDFGTGCSCLSYLHRPLAHQTAARADQLVRQFASLNAGRQCS